MNDLLMICFIGIGATGTMDLWCILRKRVLGIAPPNYGLVGRWMAYMLHGQFRHASIKASTSKRGEHIIGWTAHYLIGITFAALLLALWGKPWFHTPTPGPALIIGIGTVVAPFLIMQPGMGAGFAASQTPRPALARLHSLINHAVFGVGLYTSAVAMKFLSP